MTPPEGALALVLLLRGGLAGGRLLRGGRLRGGLRLGGGLRLRLRRRLWLRRGSGLWLRRGLWLLDSRGLGLYGLGLLRRRGPLRADRLDLDLREMAAVAVVPLVAGALLVLADADLLAERVPDDDRGDRQLAVQLVALAAHEHCRLEGL